MNSKYKINKIAGDESAVFPSIAIGGCLGNGSERIIRIMSDQTYNDYRTIVEGGRPKFYTFELEDCHRTITTYLKLFEMRKIRIFINRRIRNKKVVYKEGNLNIIPIRDSKKLLSLGTYGLPDVHGVVIHSFNLDEKDKLERNNGTSFYINIDENGFTALHEFFNRINLGDDLFLK